MEAKKMEVVLEPWERAVIRSDQPFTVFDGGSIIGPDSSTARRFAVGAAKEGRTFVVSHGKTAVVDVKKEKVTPPFEMLNFDPIEVPLNMYRPKTLQDMVRDLVREHVSQEANQLGMETFTEADDFDVGEDEDSLSPYELEEMQEEVPLQDLEPEESGAGAPPSGAPDGGQGESPDSPDSPPDSTERST